MRILAADDDLIQLETMTACLSRLPADVTTTDNGSEAWDLLSRESFDLAVIDLHMPGLDGFGLINWLRQTPRTVDLPIIVVTSRNDPEAIEKAYAAGASSFVTKPVNWPLFAHQARFVMRNGSVERDIRAARLASDISEREKLGVLSIIGEELEQAGSSPDAVAALARDLRGMARALSGEIDPQPMDCDTLLREAAALCRAQADLRGVGIALRQNLEPIDMRCDVSLLRQGLVRLARHLIEHSVAGGQVEFSAHMDEARRLMITLRGGSAEVLKPALGTELAQKVAVAHGGELVLHAVPGEGAAGVMRLPAGLASLRLRHGQLRSA